MAVRRAGHGDPRRRPLDPPADATHQRHRRPVDLEVVVVLGVERGEGLGVPDEFQVLERARRCVPGVVPALERDDHQRVGQLGQFLGG
jgi:hypothetical protein